MSNSSRRLQRAPVRYTSPPSRESSPGLAALSDCDADDEGAMSTGENTSSPQLSVAVPAHTPYCPERPTLSDILANRAPPPWTLSAFMAYLSQNHCLETLEFTMDASRYRKHFDQMDFQGPSADGREYVKMLWQRLLDAYIIPDGPREVNLPSDIRDHLLALPNASLPPSPDSLDPAVKIIYELMDESVLVPFLNSVPGYRGPSSSTSLAKSSDEDVHMEGTDDSSTSRRPRSRRSRRASSPTRDAAKKSPSTSPSGSRYGKLRDSAIASGFIRGSSLSPLATNRATLSGDNLTDDTGSAASPNREPMTPPTTPPTSDFGGTSPLARAEGTWKRMTGKMGFKKSGHSHSDRRSRDGHELGFSDDSSGAL